MQRVITPLIFFGFVLIFLGFSFSHYTVGETKLVTEEMFISQSISDMVTSRNKRPHELKSKEIHPIPIVKPKQELIKDKAPKIYSNLIPSKERLVTKPAATFVNSTKESEVLPKKSKSNTSPTDLCEQKYGFYINEIGQGSYGNQDWVELLAVGKGKLSLNGLAINDKGRTVNKEKVDHGYVYFDTTNGKRCTVLDEIPAGSLIIVYNESEKDPKIPASDPYDSNGDGVFVIPGDHLCFDGCTTSAYPCNSPNSPYFGEDNSLDNARDVLRVFQGNTTVFHGVSWGYSAQSNGTNIVNTGEGNARGYGFECGSFFDSKNWISYSSSQSSTPGKPNNAENSKFVKLLKDGLLDCKDLEECMDKEA